MGQDKDTVTENFDSDSDYGVGLELLKAMQQDGVTDTIWVVSRTCDSTSASSLGKRRFDIACQVCREAEQNE